MSKYLRQMVQDGVSTPVPYDLKAEEAVIGAILLDPENIVTVYGKVKAEDFWGEEHATIYRAMIELYEEHTPPDILLVERRLKDTEQFDAAVTYSGLQEYITRCPSSSYNWISYHAEVIARLAEHRSVIEAGGEIAALGYDTSKKGVAEKASAILDQIRSHQPTSFKAVGQVADKHFEKLRAGEEGFGVPTGFFMLDLSTGGFKPGELVIMAARPGVGKSSLICAFAANAAEYGYASAIFSLEMRKEDWVDRLVARNTGIRSQSISHGNLTDEEWEQVDREREYLHTLPLYINDTAGLSIKSLESAAQSLVAKTPIDAIFVDYLQLLSGSEGKKQENRTQEISEISRGLKLMARRLEVPVIAAAQVGREVEKRKSHEAHLSDLREGGSIENDADMVVFAHREELYDPDTYKVGLLELHIAKQRKGPQTRVPLLWHGPTSSVKDLICR